MPGQDERACGRRPWQATRRDAARPTCWLADAPAKQACLPALLPTLAGSLAQILFTTLVTTFAVWAVRVASRGLSEDADQDGDGDQRDHDQEDQGHDCETHGLPLLVRTKPPGNLPGGLILTPRERQRTSRVS